MIKLFVTVHSFAEHNVKPQPHVLLSALIVTPVPSIARFYAGSPLLAFRKAAPLPAYLVGKSIVFPLTKSISSWLVVSPLLSKPTRTSPLTNFNGSALLRPSLRDRPE